MSRSGYIDDYHDQWSLICWRGAVASAIRGKRGQAFLREMLAAMDALPEKRLITNELEIPVTGLPMGGDVCALGAVGRARGLAMGDIDTYDIELVAFKFGIPHSLACEIMHENDEHWRPETPEERFVRVRKWIESKLVGGKE